MRLFLFIFISAFSFFAQADSNTDFVTNCFKSTTPVAYGYCISQPKQNASADFVYYLHGRNGSEFSWQDDYFFTAQIRAEWAKYNVKLPTVISVSFGPVWLLASKNTSVYSGFMDLFTQVVLPQIETSLGELQGRRILFGDSMGGFNSSQLALKTTLFNKVAMLCAPMSMISPFSTADQIKTYVEASGAWQYYKDTDPNTVLSAVQDAVQISKAFFPTQTDWDGANPLELAKTVDVSALPVMYVADGFYDRYASYEPTQVFVDQLHQRGAHLQWRPQWGGHCAIDIPSLAQFLVE